MEHRERGETSKDRGQRVKLRGQRSEVRVKLISDLRLLTSVMDVFYGLNGLNDLPFTVYRLRFLRLQRLERFQSLEGFEGPKFILDKCVIFAKLACTEIKRE